VVMLDKNKKMAAEDFFIYITPKPMFFKIWPVIFSLILIVLVHNFWRDVWKIKSSLIFILSNCLMILHAGIWSFGTVPAIVIAGFVLASVDNATIWFWRVLQD